MGIPDHLIYLLRNLYTGQEATEMYMKLTGLKGGEEYIKAVYTEYIMQNAGLDESQAGIKMLGEISTSSDKQMIPL